MMLTFDQMAAPSEGWTLDVMRNRRSIGERPYWDIELMDENGAVVSGQHRNLEMAWEQAVRAAEAHDAKDKTYRRLQYGTDNRPS